MMRIAVVGLCLLTMVPAVGHAAVVDVVINGFVYGGVGEPYDDADLFYGGLVGGSPFTANYVYDTSVVESITVGSEVEYFVGGGVGSPLGNPVQGSLTVGGVTHAIGSSSSYPDIRDSGTVNLNTNYNADVGPAFDIRSFVSSAEAYNIDAAQSFSSQLFFQLYTLAGTFPSSLETGFSFSPDLLSLSSLFGNFIYNVNEDDSYISTFAQLSGDNIRVSVRNPGTDPTPSPVPLPASVLMLGAALGLMGAFRMKRRFA